MSDMAIRAPYSNWEGSLDTKTQIEELTKNMRRLKPYRKRRGRAARVSATVTDKASLPGLDAIAPKVDKLAKIQKEFLDFEKHLAKTAANSLFAQSKLSKDV